MSLLELLLMDVMEVEFELIYIKMLPLDPTTFLLNIYLTTNSK